MKVKIKKEEKIRLNSRLILTELGILQNKISFFYINNLYWKKDADIKILNNGNTYYLSLNKLEDYLGLKENYLEVEKNNFYLINNTNNIEIDKRYIKKELSSELNFAILIIIMVVLGICFIYIMELIMELHLMINQK